MPTIHLTTFIAAPAERIFDLSRSINLHRISATSTQERAVDGVMNGLISESEYVTWEARHLFKTRRFTSHITSMQKPFHFTDEMTMGDFKRFRHEHHFKTIQNGTLLIDCLEFETPFGFIGRFLNKVYLEKYIERFLQHRNMVIKDYAETEKWKSILS